MPFVPAGCVSEGATALVTSLERSGSFDVRRLGKNTTIDNTIKTAALTNAGLCRRKRRHASRAGDNGLDVRPWPAIDSTSMLSGASSESSGGSSVCSTTASSPGRSWFTSVKADPRVEDAVQEVGDEVEDDDGEDDDHHPREDVDVLAVAERLQEVPTHPVDTEDLFGDDEPAHDRADVDRRVRHHGNQRIAHRVLHDDSTLGDALGARRSEVVRAQHV